MALRRKVSVCVYIVACNLGGIRGRLALSAYIVRQSRRYDNRRGSGRSGRNFAYRAYRGGGRGRLGLDAMDSGNRVRGHIRRNNAFGKKRLVRQNAETAPFVYRRQTFGRYFKRGNRRRGQTCGRTFTRLFAVFLGRSDNSRYACVYDKHQSVYRACRGGAYARVAVHRKIYNRQNLRTFQVASQNHGRANFAR